MGDCYLIFSKSGILEVNNANIILYNIQITGQKTIFDDKLCFFSLQNNSSLQLNVKNNSNNRVF